MQRTLHATRRISHGASRLGCEVNATNEYGEYDGEALALYGLEMVVEPHRATRITVSSRLPLSEISEKSEKSPSPSPPSSSSSRRRYYWLLVRADSSGAALDDVTPLVDARGYDRFVTVTLTDAGEKYALLVQQVEGDDGTVVAEQRVTISCKYVRRELRGLTIADRTGFFAAMREFYTVSLEEGRALYGDGFYDAKLMAAYHNTRDYCFHNGMHFLNAHAAFDLWVESNLQKIDPKVSLPQWDYMLEAAHLGTEWGDSEIFGPDMFGSALGSPDNQFQISDGWFSNISSVYDPAGDLLSAEADISTNHNPYGFVGSTYNYQSIPGVSRTSSYCGLQGVSEFSKCEVFVGCFEDNNSLYEWAVCMEHSVHASMHGMIGGGFNCNVNMAEFQEANPQFSPELLTFTLQFLLANKWPSNSLMEDFNYCDEDCAVGQTHPCGCTCITDPFEWTDDAIYDFMEDAMETLQLRAHGDQFIDEDRSARHPLGFAQKGKRLDDESIMLLLRQLMVIGCEPGEVGAMSTGAAPLDPIFWALHAGFDKAQHILQLSPGYRDTYDFAWVDSESCDDMSGGKLDDLYPWTERMLGLGDGTELLTNSDLVEILHPSNPKLPYVYEGFNKWGTCTDWDPCPECDDGSPA
ncbi:TYR [Ectocarpus sp. CCAP 1310/34]|nr:TYR [Ectocarpus sp. CCAP 1310/34]